MAAMLGGMFGGGSTAAPTPAPAPLAPTEDPVAKRAREAAAEEERRRASKGGRSSTDFGVTGTVGSASKQLLGA